MRHHRRVQWTVIALVMMVLAGVGRQVVSGQQRPVVIAQGVDATYLDPNIDLPQPNINISSHIFDTLLSYEYDPTAKGAQMKLVPTLAESWQARDPQNYVFKLRRGVRFHDGTELRASDVKFTFDRVKDPALRARMVQSYLEAVAEVRVIDDLTVEVRLNVPFAPFLNRLAGLFIVPEAHVRRVGPAEFNRRPIGSGPYRFVEWVRDERVVLQANPSYWRGKPQIEQVIFRPIPEAATRMAALRSGQVDLITNVPTDAVESLKADPNVNVQVVRSGRIIFIYMNTFREPLNIRRVRQALNYAVDWDRIMKNVLGGYAYRTPIPCTPYDFGCNQTIKGYDYDPARARKLLAEAGFPNGFDTTLDSPNGRYLMDKEVAQAVAGELAKVGVRARVSIQEWGVYYNQRFLGAKIEGLGLFGMGNPIFDTDHLMAVHFDPTRRSIYFNTSELTRLAHEGKSTPDPAKRKRIYDQAMRLLITEAPWIFGYGQMDLYATSKRLVWKARPDEELPMFDAKVQ